MRGALAMAALTVRQRRRRLIGLALFGMVFLVAGAAAALLFGEGGDVHLDQLFIVGGYPLASGALLLGWLLGRLPLIAVLVLMAGLVSEDRHNGMARLTAIRPASLPAVYGVRFAVLALLAFAVSAVVMPLFDVLMLGQWAGPATLVLIAANVVVYGGLVALLSVWTRADAWIALFLATCATLWAALLRADAVPIGAGARQFITFLLPPQPALFALENAFADVAPIPWNAFAYAVGWGAAMLMLAGVSLRRRQL